MHNFLDFYLIINLLLVNNECKKKKANRAKQMVQHTSESSSYL